MIQAQRVEAVGEISGYHKNLPAQIMAAPPMSATIRAPLPSASGSPKPPPRVPPRWLRAARRARPSH